MQQQYIQYTIYFLSEFSLWNHTQYREFENCRWRIGVRELWVTRGGEHQVDLEELGRAPVGRRDNIYTGQLKPFQRVQYIEEVEIDRYHIFYFFKGIVFLSLSHSYYLLTTFMAHQNHPSLLVVVGKSLKFTKKCAFDLFFGPDKFTFRKNSKITLMDWLQYVYMFFIILFLKRPYQNIQG